MAQELSLHIEGCGTITNAMHALLQWPCAWLLCSSAVQTVLVKHVFSNMALSNVKGYSTCTVPAAHVVSTVEAVQVT